MEDPVPILIDVSGCEKLKGVYSYLENGYAIAFIVNSSHSTKALVTILNFRQKIQNGIHGIRNKPTPQ